MINRSWLKNWSRVVHWLVDRSWMINRCCFVDWSWMVNWSWFMDWSSMISTLYWGRLVWNGMAFIWYVSNISGVMVRGVFYVLEPSIRNKDAIMSINSISIWVFGCFKVCTSVFIFNSICVLVRSGFITGKLQDMSYAVTKVKIIVLSKRPLMFKIFLEDSNWILKWMGDKEKAMFLSWPINTCSSIHTLAHCILLIKQLNLNWCHSMFELAFLPIMWMKLLK